LSESVFGIDVDTHLTTSAALRDIARAPSPHVQAKVTDHIDALSRRFIAASPLAVVATTRPDGTQDLTPRGDPAGFVHVLNDRLLALPDRPGNFRMDTMENLFVTPHIGLIFLIPGHNDTLRVSGTGAVVQDAALGERLAVNGRPAKFTILVKVTRVLSHCSKAFVRGRVWQQDQWPDRSDVPSLAEMLIAHAKMSDPIEALEQAIRTNERDELY